VCLQFYRELFVVSSRGCHLRVYPFNRLQQRLFFISNLQKGCMSVFQLVPEECLLIIASEYLLVRAVDLLS